MNFAATFQVVLYPFTHLFSIHMFIKRPKSMKQVPVAFVLMTKRQAVDYTEVLIPSIRIGFLQNTPTSYLLPPTPDRLVFISSLPDDIFIYLISMILVSNVFSKKSCSKPNNIAMGEYIMTLILNGLL